MLMSRPVRVFLICPGVGHIARGYESFTRECFEALRGDPRIDLYLFKGAGPNAGRERRVWCLWRTRPLARMLGAIADVHHDAYYIEQLTFTLALLPHIVLKGPDVIFFSDPAIGHLLWWWRRATRSNFKLLLSNGGPTGPPAFPRFDHVHQVSPICYEDSARAGRSSKTQTLLPYGFNIDEARARLSIQERRALRKKLALPIDRRVVLTVGTINSSHKRMDYVVKEIAAMAQPRPYLVMLGQFDTETPKILALADRLLSENGFQCKTVPMTDVSEFYDAADVFVLASFNEGLPRVLVEAQLHGLPCLAHDGLIQRHLLGEQGTVADFAQPNALADLLGSTLSALAEGSFSSDNLGHLRERFGWNHLAGQYVDMVLRCAQTSTFEPVPAGTVAF